MCGVWTRFHFQKEYIIKNLDRGPKHLPHLGLGHKGSLWGKITPTPERTAASLGDVCQGRLHRGASDVTVVIVDNVVVVVVVIVGGARRS